MCKCMKVSKNAYYSWKRKKATNNKKLTYLKQRITYHFKKSFQIYGSTRIQKKLQLEGLNYSVSYIGKLMRVMNLKSILKQKFVVTTNSKHDNPIAKNILNRDFCSNQVGEKWVSDITYIPVANTWNYLTTIIDLADRKVAVSYTHLTLPTIYSV